MIESENEAYSEHETEIEPESEVIEVEGPPEGEL